MTRTDVIAAKGSVARPFLEAAPDNTWGGLLNGATEASISWIGEHFTTTTIKTAVATRTPKKTDTTTVAMQQLEQLCLPLRSSLGEKADGRVPYEGTTVLLPSGLAIDDVMVGRNEDDD